MVRKNKENEFMKALDEQSKAIILHISRNRHAKIRELSKLISAPNDNYTLIKIREVINPAAQQILGYPILSFEENKIDPITGTKHFFSWWLTHEIKLLEQEKQMLDIFDEKDYLKIVTELPDAKENEIKINVDNDALVICTNNNHKTVPLFYPVEKQIEKTYKNGILEINLRKIK